MDDQTLFRAGLARLLDEDPRIQVVGHGANGLEALELTERLRPDVVLMDVQMPKLDGIEATRRLRLKAPEVKVIILTGFEDDEPLVHAMDAGATGYVLKDAEPDTIVSRVVASRDGSDSRAPDRAHDGLTGREVEILKLVAVGLANKQVAVRLGISDKTVRNHLHKAYERLGINTRTEAVVYAAKNGLLRL